jgi:hypothetical protein
VGLGIERQDNLHAVRALNFLGIHGNSIAHLEKLGSVPVLIYA